MLALPHTDLAELGIVGGDKELLEVGRGPHVGSLHCNLLATRFSGHARAALAGARRRAAACKHKRREGGASRVPGGGVPAW